MAGSRRVQTKTLNLPFALYHDGTRGWSVYGNPYGSGPQYGSGSATITAMGVVSVEDAHRSSERRRQHRFGAQATRHHEPWRSVRDSDNYADVPQPKKG